MSMEISTTSLEYVRVQVDAIKNGAVYDPTTDVVAFAFLDRGKGNDLSGASWLVGSWETSPAGTHYARCLIGPGGGVATLAAGAYSVWVKISDSPEIPIKKSGALTVY